MKHPLFAVLPVALVVAAGLTPAAQADVIFGDPDPALGFILFRGDYPDFFADNFVLQAEASVLTDIHWWGGYGGGNGIADDDFTVQIFADDGTGNPEVTPSVLDLDGAAVTRADTGETAGFGVDVYAYSLDIAPLALTPGVTYYLAIYNETPDDEDVWGWFAVNDPGDGFWYRFADSGNPWLPGETERDMAFYLTNNNAVVPEPASLFLLGLGMAGLCLRRRKTRA